MVLLDDRGLVVVHAVSANILAFLEGMVQVSWSLQNRQISPANFI
jgi:hypothetical protein